MEENSFSDEETTARLQAPMSREDLLRRDLFNHIFGRGGNLSADWNAYKSWRVHVLAEGDHTEHSVLMLTLSVLLDNTRMITVDSHEMVDSVDELSAHITRSIRRVFAPWCALLLTDGAASTEDGYKQFMDTLRASTPERCCSESWGDGVYIYRCRDCEVSSCSCICIKCFEHGDHSGHNVLFERSYYGGCCDCGNPDSWKEAGFCSLHSGISNDTQSLDPVLARKATQIFRHVLAVVDRMLRFSMPGENQDTFSFELAGKERLQSVFCALADFLLQELTPRLTGHVEALQDILRRELILSPERIDADAPLPRFSQPLQLIIEHCNIFSKNMIDFLLSLMQDYEFKVQLTITYLRCYPKFVDKFSSESGDESTFNLMYKLAAQFFSVPSICLRFVKEEGDLNVLRVMNSALNRLFRLALMPQRPEDNYYQPFDITQRRFSLQCLTIILYDYQTILRHEEVAEYVIVSQIEEVKALMTTRQTDYHVEWDLDTYRLTSFLNFRMSEVFTSLHNGFERVLKRMSAKDGVELTTKICTSLYDACGEHLAKMLSKWHKEEPDNFDKESGHNVILWRDVSTENVSTGFPLQKFIIALISACVKTYPKKRETARTLMNALTKRESERREREKEREESGETVPFSLFYADFAVAQAFSAQVIAGMWRRNGNRALGTMETYRYEPTEMEADLFLGQLCCEHLPLFGPRWLLHLLLRTYGVKEHMIGAFLTDTNITPLASLSDEQTDDRHMKNQLCLDLLNFVHDMILNRSKWSNSTEANVLNIVILILAYRTAKRSEIIKAFDENQDRLVDEALKVAADYSPPTKDSPGMYRLKASMWKYVNIPLFAGDVPQSERQLIQEAYRARLKADKSLYPPLLTDSIGDDVDLRDGGARGMLTDPLLHEMLFIQLDLATMKDSDEFTLVMSDCAQLCVRLASLCVNYELNAFDAENAPEGNAEATGFVGFRTNSFLSNALERVDVRKHRKQSSEEHKLCMLDTFVQLYEKKDVDIITKRMLSKMFADACKRHEGWRRFLVEALPSLFNESAESNVDDEESTKKRAAARRRRANIMKRFKSQQKGFERQHEDLIANTTEDSNSDSRICALCRSDANKPMGLVAYAQNTPVPNIVARYESKQREEMENEGGADDAKERPSKRMRTESSFAWDSDTGYLSIVAPVDEDASEQDDRVLLSSCGHVVHIDCIHTYVLALVERERRGYPMGGGVDLHRCNFQCPLCRHLSNCIMPLFSEDSVRIRGAYESDKEQESENGSESESESAEEADEEEGVELLTIFTELEERYPHPIASGTMVVSDNDLKMADPNIHPVFQLLPNIVAEPPTAGTGSPSQAEQRRLCAQNFALTRVLAQRLMLVNMMSSSWSRDYASLELTDSHAPSLPLCDALVRSSRVGLDCLEICCRNDGATLLQWQCLLHMWRCTRNALLMAADAGQVYFRVSDHLNLRTCYTCVRNLGVVVPFMLLHDPKTADFFKVLKMAYLGAVNNALTDLVSSAKCQNLRRTHNGLSLCSAGVMYRALESHELPPDDEATLFGLCVGDASVHNETCEFDAYLDERLRTLLLRTLRTMYVCLCAREAFNVQRRAERRTTDSAVETVDSGAKIQEIFERMVSTLKSDGRNVDALCSLLRLPVPSRLFSAIGDALPLSYRTVSVFRPAASRELRPLQLPVRFVRLPPTIQEVLLRYSAYTCGKCGLRPQYPGICLLCGQCVCLHMICCATPEKEGSAHAHTCGNGVGLYVSLKSTRTVVLHHEKAAYLPSLYVDQFGEDDVDIKRGKTLYLAEDRYQDYVRMYVAHAFDSNATLMESNLRARQF